MLLDHLQYINALISSDLVTVFNIVSRCVAPMFAYLAVDGIRHTRNLKKYCVRLSTAAVVMFAGNALWRAVFTHFSSPLSHNMQMLLQNNIFFTLALGVITIALIQQGKNREVSGKVCIYTISVILFAIGFLYGEWGTVLLPFMLIEYFLCKRKQIRVLGYVLIEIIAVILPFSEPLWFLVFPLILLYNGERGSKTSFSKYFFYIFYPAHLWIIAIINLVMEGAFGII